MSTTIWLAANRGDIGGGEVMLARITDSLAELGCNVRIVAPSHPGDVAAALSGAGHSVVQLPATDRRGYAAALRRWDRKRAPTELLWCNGLLPAVATSASGNRLVHLHQLPSGAQQFAWRVAALRSRGVVVPSSFLRSRLSGRHRVHVLPNWTEQITLRPRRVHTSTSPLVIGFMGRIGLDKGTDVLARGVAGLPAATRSGLRLLIAGDSRFVPPGERGVIEAALTGAGVVVEQAGWIPREAYLSAIDVAVVPSVAPEAFGLAAAEAMAAGVPLIVSDAGALPEVVGPQHPWVVPAGDANALGDMLDRVISAPTEVAGPVAAARERWQAGFSPASGVRATAQLLESI